MSEPITPPREESSLAFEINIVGNPLNYTAVGQASASQSPALPTPESQGMGMDLDELDAKNEPAEQSQSLDLYDEDEDQDMSDGGVPLTHTDMQTTYADADTGHVSYDAIDPAGMDVLYDDDYEGLDIGPTFQNSPVYASLDASTGESMEVVVAQETLHPIETQSPISVYNMQAAMEVSQQLQHLQDGQAQDDGPITADEQGQFNLENSTAPFSLPSPSSNITPSEHLQFISLPDISSINTVAAAAGSTNAPHLWSTQGSTPSPAFDILYSQNDSEIHLSLSSSQNLATGDDDVVSQADPHEVDEQFNLSLGDFLDRWGMSAREDSRRRRRGPDLKSVLDQSMTRRKSIVTSDLRGDWCDIQGIDWKSFGVSREEARQMRRQTYRNYTNLRVANQSHPRLHGSHLRDDESFFKFRRMDFDHDVHLSHFQLRNLLAGTSRNNIFYAGRSQVIRVDPSLGRRNVVMDLTDPTVQSFHFFSGGIQISTLTAGHDILVAGGFSGEYGLTNLKSQEDSRHVDGVVTNHHNSITNHIQVHLSRTSSSPLAAFASNDSGLRLLDIATNTFISDQKFDYAVNCSAISPDQRLRVLVGDSRKVLICNAESGEILQKLDGHRDFGFACDWADDGWTVATGNQDMQVKIWDARKWTNSHGEAKPVTTIAAEMAGVRKLKFSPLGTGKRVLIAAEPADFINVIDAETFSSKQTLSFFGEIGGLDFINNGQNLIVANCDGMRGGIMNFERCNLASEGLYDANEYIYSGDTGRRKSFRETGLDWRPTVDEVVAHPRSQRTATHRRRRAVNLASIGSF
ncbi:hypothetical protein BP5796_07490 [Coleophoma crateriformis]|uniref:Uncharacterized protein n=1 Tax=Coleophoma crateriformis TaxID=565419 RepID=A0A3D8RJE2_9HELO|nr:hypothetical protein BP5796_07490 [Coleophoma crateriformis]